MKKYTRFIAILFFVPLFYAVPSIAQPGYITTIAGNGTSGYSGDGGPATSAQIGQALGAHADGMGNLYIDDKDNHRIRKVTPAGIITTIAGGGTSTADGIPATAAYLTLDDGATMTIDMHGNLFVRDGQSIRKIDVATGIITNIVGTGTAGFSGDGGPATAAQVSDPGGICFDVSGNMYIGDGGNSRIRKINTSGIISTYAGTGVLGFSGDGGPATGAQFNSPCGVYMDLSGNLYIADVFNFRIRKIDPSGIISTYAGSGLSGFGGDGGPATAARFNEPSNLCTDSYGNLYIADFHNSRVRKVTPSGIITTFAGGGSSLGSGIPATAASFTDVWGISVDWNNNIYVPDRHHNRICKVEGVSIPTAVADSFSVFVRTVCTGPELTITPAHYSSSLTVKTWFGDGKTQTDTFSVYSGRAWYNHVYSHAGVYTIKHVLYSGTMPVDSVSYSYTYQFCRTLPVKLYHDANANCIFEAGTEPVINQPSVIEVDSAGVAIDTLSVTSGFYYEAYGATGTVYTFKVISTPVGVVVSCPTTGSITATLLPTPNNQVNYFGLACSSTPGYDLRVFPSFRAGSHHFGGTIIADNTYCIPPAAILTMELNPRYTDALYFSPTPASIVGNVVTWNINTLSAVLSKPFLIQADMEKTPGALLPYGDTIVTQYAINPIAGDADGTSNMVIRVDTVKSGYDPNDISVDPAGCLAAGITNLTYTIHFENQGNDTAFNIHVLDTLSSELDPKSMRIVVASAEMNTSISKAGGYTIVKFDFPGINLLDSSHHGLCNGMVIYNINMKPGLAPGTVIPNRAGIYFDDNPVVLTNTAMNVIGCPTGVAEVDNNNMVAVYPNPVGDVLTIETINNQHETCVISNSIGQVLIQQALNLRQTKVDVKMLPAGLYYITLKGAGGSVVKKFVKM